MTHYYQEIPQWQEDNSLKDNNKAAADKTRKRMYQDLE